MSKTTLTTQHARDLRKNLLVEFKKYLEKFGVIYPLNGALEPALLALYEQNGGALTQQQMADFHKANATDEYTLQIRHLADKGWDIRSGNSRFSLGMIDDALNRDQYRLNSTNSPNPIWLERTGLTRVGDLTALEWKEKLEIWKNHGCAVCGQKFANYDKGHLDSSRGLFNANIAPMCSRCNNWAQAHKVDFVLDGLIARPIMKKS